MRSLGGGGAGVASVDGGGSYFVCAARSIEWMMVFSLAVG